MSKRKSTRKRATTAIAARPLTEAQLETFIHAGPVTKERRQHADIATEIIEKTSDGWPIQVRQMVSTPVRKLLEQEAVGFAEVFGATMLRWDHDMALYNRLSGKWEMRVDGGGMGMADMEKRLFHAKRMREAFMHLGHELGQIAWLSVIERPIGDLKATHTSVGQSLLPKGTGVEQRGAGKGSLVITVRELSRFYKLTNAPDLPYVQQMAMLDCALDRKKFRITEKVA
jgi:hypothetical protein